MLVWHQVYSSWIRHIKTRLGKVDRLMRRMSIAIWLLSHHAATMQPLHKRYSTRLEQISSKAGRIREALLRSQEFISVEADVMRRLQEMKVLDQRVQEMLAPPQRLAAQQEDASNTKYRVIFYQGIIFLEAVN